MSPFRDTLAAKLRRALGGEDKRPPKNWPFPTWKGQAIATVADDGPPMPARRGPKPKARPTDTEEDAPL